MEETQKKVLIVVAILIIVGAAGYFLLSNQYVEDTLDPDRSQVTPSESEQESGDQESQDVDKKASDKTRQLIEEVKQKQQENEEAGKESESKVVQIPEEGGEEGGEDEATSSTGVVVAEGSSPIKSDTGEVVTEEGEKADNTAEAGSPEAPRQSFWVEDKSQLPESTLRMNITPSNIDPAEFTVEAGEVVSLAVTAAGDKTEILRFDDERLSGVAVGLASGKTRVINFNAPDEPGEYTYYSEIANHRSQGAEGVMIVE